MPQVHMPYHVYQYIHTYTYEHTYVKTHKFYLPFVLSLMENVLEQMDFAYRKQTVGTQMKYFSTKTKADIVCMYMQTNNIVKCLLI